MSMRVHSALLKNDSPSSRNKLLKNVTPQFGFPFPKSTASSLSPLSAAIDSIPSASLSRRLIRSPSLPHPCHLEHRAESSRSETLDLSFLSLHIPFHLTHYLTRRSPCPSTSLCQCRYPSQCLPHDHHPLFLHVTCHLSLHFPQPNISIMDMSDHVSVFLCPSPSSFSTPFV